MNKAIIYDVYSSILFVNFFKKSIFGASILSIAVHDLSSTIAVSINGTAVTLLVHVGTT